MTKMTLLSVMKMLMKWLINLVWKMKMRKNLTQMKNMEIGQKKTKIEFYLKWIWA